MPKRNIAYLPGHYYHIYNRGVARQFIFHQEENYPFLLRKLKDVLAECNISMIAYALLPNHYHWLVRQDGIEAAGKVPTRVFNTYTQALNKAFARLEYFLKRRTKLLE